MIGLIFGETACPKYILKKIKKKYKYLIIDLTTKKIFKKNKKKIKILKKRLNKKKNIQKREKFIPCFNWSIWKNFINTKI